MTDKVISFPGRHVDLGNVPEMGSADWRPSDLIYSDMQRHTQARLAYAKAVAWEAAAKDQSLPQAKIEEAVENTAKAFEELRYTGRSLLVVMPTEPRALIDLLMYLEKHFSLLPQEVDGRALALAVIKNTRLSLRPIARYGKF